MKPKTITAQDERRWQRNLKEYQRSGQLPLFAALPRFREMFFAGEWLGEELAKLGVPPGDASDICFANGQRSAMGGDPWSVAQQTLADVKAGDAPKPGPDLAASLVKGRSIAALLNPLIERGVTPFDVDRYLLDPLRDQPLYPPQPEPEGEHAHLFRELRERAGRFPEPVIEAFLTEYRRLWEEKSDAV